MIRLIPAGPHALPNGWQPRTRPGLLSAPNPTRAPAGHVTGGRLVIGGDVTVL